MATFLLPRYSSQPEILLERVRWGTRAYRLNRRARDVGAPGRVSPSELRELVLEHGPFCHYCGCFLDFASQAQRGRLATFDHVMPLWCMGSNTIDNLVPACAQCNALQERDVEDWRYERMLFLKYGRHADRWRYSLPTWRRRW